MHGHHPQLGYVFSLLTLPVPSPSPSASKSPFPIFIVVIIYYQLMLVIYMVLILLLDLTALLRLWYSGSFIFMFTRSVTCLCFHSSISNDDQSLMQFFCLGFLKNTVIQIKLICSHISWTLEFLKLLIFETERDRRKITYGLHLLHVFSCRGDFLPSCLVLNRFSFCFYSGVFPWIIIYISGQQRQT